MKKITKKIQIFSLFLICLFYYVIRGKANKKQKELRKFLVAQMAKLGDMVCTTPVFHAIKEKNSKNQVFVLTSKINKDLLEYNQDIDGSFIYHKDRFWEAVKEIKKENFDYGCVVDCNFVGLAALYLSGINFISAPILKEKKNNPYKFSYYSILCKLVAVPFFYHFNEYMPLTRMRSLEAAGIYSKDISKHLAFSGLAEKKIKSFFQSENINKDKDIVVAIHVGAGNKVKLWAPENWAKLIDEIVKNKNIKVILTGSKIDEEEVRAVLSLVKSKIIDASLKFNIDEFKALISQIDVFIACDSGPIYVAEAFNKYIIDIIGPVTGKEQPPCLPYYSKGKIIFKNNLFCYPCSFIMNAAKTCRFKNNKCLEEIGVSDVLIVANEIIEKIKK
jgi:ADP-heptose:LPS heptosyltransferase